LADAHGIHNVLVTNGYMTEQMLDECHPYLDAANVDLKAFRESTYRKYIGARLEPVLDNLKRMKQLGVWLEVTMLVIPGLNDDASELRDAATFISRELGPHTPWHISRFFPAHQFNDVPPTPLSTLHQTRQIGRDAGLRYVYLGNISADDQEDTVCHQCGRVLVRRPRAGAVENHVSSEGRCPDCRTAVAGVGMGSEPASLPARLSAK
jgi:pyruvate formate lyase activating enzyme